MAADMAVELRKQNVTCVSLWPGPVRTELIQELVLDKAAEGEKVIFDMKWKDISLSDCVQIRSTLGQFKQDQLALTWAEWFNSENTYQPACIFDHEWKWTKVIIKLLFPLCFICII